MLARLEKELGVLDERSARVALLRLTGSPARLAALVRHQGSALRALEPDRESPTDFALTAQDLRRIALEFRRMEATGTRAVIPGDDEWPLSLESAVRPPAVIFVRGTLPRTGDGPGLAIVGSRRDADYGCRVAAMLAQGWASLGGWVVSGGALGVDAAAHRGCLEAGGKTVAVLGTGLDQLYPPANGPLFASILENGAVLSELPMRAPARPSNFPQRNRIIAGLARAIVVAQARRKSGALYTATFALKCGRLLFTVPAPVDDEACAGGVDLLIQGIPAMAGTEQLSKLYFDLTGHSGARISRLPMPARQMPSVARAAVGKTEGLILEMLAGREVHVDDLAAGLNMGQGPLSLVLLSMELKDWVVKKAGNHYRSKIRLEG
jgi:DNA processing protein